MNPAPQAPTPDSKRRAPSRLHSDADIVRRSAEPVLGAPILLAGPTAVGKSEIALWLAEKVGGEIVSVDSMQVYRGLDIGTAKPSLADRARVPHHLVDVIELNEAFDAAQFVALAGRAVADIRARGRVPILCGGTGLYFKALLEGLGDAPPADPALRAELEAIPLPDLLRELAERDPVAYEKIDRQNPRRVIRAVEVIRLTGKPFSEQRARWGETHGEPLPADSGSRGRSPHPNEPPPIPQPPSSFRFGFKRSSSDLHQRIETRVEDMFRRGLVAETGRLLERGLAENPTALQALGYRQVVEHLRGQRPLAETVELVKIRTRQFAKRQMTWFRRQLRLEWIELEPEAASDEIAARLAAWWRV
jgi:tRNA dimethylallyltransferase